MENEFDYRKYMALLNNNKRLFVVTALAIMTGAVLLCYVLPKKYEAQSTFFVEKNAFAELITGITTSRRNETQDALQGLNYAIKSRSLVVNVMNDLDMNVKQSDAQLESLIMSLQGRTDVKIIEKEGLITVSFMDRNPRLARDYVNALVRRFLEENLSSKREESYVATTFLSDQIASTKDKLDKIEAEIAKLRAKYGPAIEMAAGTMMDSIAGQQRLDDLILRRTQLEATRNLLRNSNPAKIRLAALQRRLEELRVEYTDNYPEVIKLKADIETARKEANSGSKTVADPQELARVEAELSAVRASEASQRAIIGRGGRNVDPAARTAMENLMQERISLRATYDQLMARQNQAEMSKQMAVQDKSTTFKIIDPAVIPLFPKSPNRIKFILIGIAAGLVGGLALLLAIDYFDKSVKTVEELKSIGINIMAVIPKISDPMAVEREQKRDRKLCLVAGTYFSVIVALLALESLGMSPVDGVIRMIIG